MTAALAPEPFFFMAQDDPLSEIVQVAERSL